MSAAGVAKDTFASGAKPRREARVCERGWHPTPATDTTGYRAEGARRARRRAIAHAADTPTRRDIVNCMEAAA
jgi:hypothetical protein